MDFFSDSWCKQLKNFFLLSPWNLYRGPVRQRWMEGWWMYVCMCTNSLDIKPVGHCKLITKSNKKITLKTIEIFLYYIIVDLKKKKKQNYINILIDKIKLVFYNFNHFSPSKAIMPLKCKGLLNVRELGGGGKIPY